MKVKTILPKVDITTNAHAVAVLYVGGLTVLLVHLSHLRILGSGIKYLITTHRVLSPTDQSCIVLEHQYYH